MVTVFYDANEILLVELMERGKTIHFEVNCNTLRKLKRAIYNKRRSLLTSGVVFLHDNARPRSARRTHDLLRKFKWGVFNHFPYSRLGSL